MKAHFKGMSRPHRMLHYHIRELSKKMIERSKASLDSFEKDQSIKEQDKARNRNYHAGKIEGLEDVDRIVREAPHRRGAVAGIKGALKDAQKNRDKSERERGYHDAIDSIHSNLKDYDKANAFILPKKKVAPPTPSEPEASKSPEPEQTSSTAAPQRGYRRGSLRSIAANPTQKAMLMIRLSDLSKAYSDKKEKSKANASEKAQKKPAPKPISLEDLEGRLIQEQAQCCQEYDAARKDLALHHSRMKDEEAELLQTISTLRPKVERMVEGEASLTPETARQALQYLELHARLRRVRQARRMSYGATLPVGQKTMGQAIGDRP